MFNIEINFLIQILLSLIIIFVILFFYYRKSKSFVILSKNFKTIVEEKENLLKNYNATVNDYNALNDKYKNIIIIDEAITQRQIELQKKEKSITDLCNEYSNKEKKLNDDYVSKKKIFDELLRELQILEEDLEFKSFGLYNPHYDFDTSEKYKLKTDEIRDKQKEIIKEKRAAICETNWTVNNSVVEGRKLTKQFGQLMLRAFNGECDATILKVRWNNIIKMEERLKNAYKVINKLGTTHYIILSPGYLELKLEELHLTYEYEQKKQDEKEEARRIREEAKEEEKVQKEIDETLKQSDKEEMLYQDALEKARKEIVTAKENEISSLNQKIDELQKRLLEVNERRERAIARAQLTKSGYVYIISNIGSFGENIFKIGMTRRLEPLDRIRELGDASVPFRFDLHALIYSDNAPELENNLHKAFDLKRLNMINNRKEFYKVSLEEIELVVKETKSDIEFIKLPEAREFRETIAIINKNKNQEEIKEKYKFPESLLSQNAT